MQQRRTYKVYEDWLNEGSIPEKAREENGGRIPTGIYHYGTWLRKHDPIAFRCGFNDWVDMLEREDQKQEKKRR